jgi:hypothetical protein
VFAFGRHVNLGTPGFAFTTTSLATFIERMMAGAMDRCVGCLICTTMDPTPRLGSVCCPTGHACTCGWVPDPAAAASRRPLLLLRCSAGAGCTAHHAACVPLDVIASCSQVGPAPEPCDIPLQSCEAPHNMGYDSFCAFFNKDACGEQAECAFTPDQV